MLTQSLNVLQFILYSYAGFYLDPEMNELVHVMLLRGSSSSLFSFLVHVF